MDDLLGDDVVVLAGRRAREATAEADGVREEAAHADGAGRVRDPPRRAGGEHEPAPHAGRVQSRLQGLVLHGHAPVEFVLDGSAHEHPVVAVVGHAREVAAGAVVRDPALAEPLPDRLRLVLAVVDAELLEPLALLLGRVAHLFLLADVMLVFREVARVILVRVIPMAGGVLDPVPSIITRRRSIWCAIRWLRPRPAT